MNFVFRFSIRGGPSAGRRMRIWILRGCGDCEVGLTVHWDFDLVGGIGRASFAEASVPKRLAVAVTVLGD